MDNNVSGLQSPSEFPPETGPQAGAGDVKNKEMRGKEMAEIKPAEKPESNAIGNIEDVKSSSKTQELKQLINNIDKQSISFFSFLFGKKIDKHQASGIKASILRNIKSAFHFNNKI